MRSNKAIVIAIAVLVLGWGLGAEDQPVKIGIVDIDQAIGATAAGKSAREELDQKKREAELELQPMIERYQELAGEYQKKRVVLSDEKRREMELDITELVYYSIGIGLLSLILICINCVNCDKRS